MANPVTPSTELTTRLTFNSGKVDLGANSLCAIQNVSVEVKSATEMLRKLNSIKVADIKRKTFDVMLKGKVKSVNKEFYEAYFGASSVDGSGTLVTFVDGQVSAINPIFTAYLDDDTTKPVQFQFINAVITAMPLNANMEAYGEVDFEMVAEDVQIYFAE